MVALKNYQRITASPWGLDCSNCPRGRRCETWGEEGTGYRFEGQRLLDRDWERCPASYLTTPQISVAFSLFNASKVSALEGWPVRWSAWVVEHITAIQQTLEEARRDAVDRSME